MKETYLTFPGARSGKSAPADPPSGGLISIAQDPEYKGGWRITYHGYDGVRTNWCAASQADAVAMKPMVRRYGRLRRAQAG